jgi:hypothetical protein
MLMALAACLLAQLGPAPQPDLPKEAKPADTITVVLPARHAALLEGGPMQGRVIVFLVSTQAGLGNVSPSDAPFFNSPQPIYSFPVSALTAGTPVSMKEPMVSFPIPIGQLTGEYQVQAVFDRHTSERGHLAPGNLLSEVQTVTLDAGRADQISLEFAERIAQASRPVAPNLRFFSMKSPMLSQAAGRDVYMRAGVALPYGWDDPSYRRRLWPTMYVIPGFGGRDTGAEGYARMLATPGSKEIVPQAVWIVLDPESEWGHHGFVDSPANGPRAKALVQELIPELERQFRLISRPDARVVTGHSSGAWSSLWLQLNHPETFGACFASAPDPVDFSAFQLVDLYTDTNYLSDAEGREFGSYRVPIVKHFEKVRMTNREEAGMEQALSPEGRSGEQLDTYNSMWSALDPRTRLPRRMFNPQTGAIDRQVIEQEWSRYDIARLIKSKPAILVPIMNQRVRLLVGARDNFYLNRAVERLDGVIQAQMKELAARGTPLPPGPGYIQVLPEETHFTLPGASMLRWHSEMRQYLAQHNLD